MDIVQIGYFLTTSILLTLAPGPDILYVLAQSMSFGKISGIVTALGLVSGVFIHVTLTALGVAAIIKESPLLFQFIQYAGAAYLIYLAYKTLQENNFTLNQESKQKENFALYRQGFYMSLLNPKLIIFFLAFFPQFINRQHDHQILQVFILGIIFVLQALAIFSLVSVFADFFSKNMRNQKFLKIMNYSKALFLFVIALSLLFIH